MSGTRRPVTDFGDWMRQQERRAMSAERRPQITLASDLMGPGLGPQAVLISDWNNDVIEFNGFYYSTPGAVNSPDPTAYWMGMSLCDGVGDGFQRVTNYTDGSAGVTLLPTWPGLTYTRGFASPDGLTRVYSPWQPENPSWQQMAGSASTINSTTQVLIPDLTLDIPVYSTSQVFMVTVDLDVEHSAATSSLFTAQLFVNNIAHPHPIATKFGSLSFRAMQSATMRATGIAPGVRTFKVMSSIDTPGDSYLIHSNSTMSVLRIA